MSSITCEATKLDPNRISFIVQALRSKNIMNQLRNWWARIGWKSVSHTVERRQSFSAFCLAEFRSWKNWSCELYVFFLWGNKSKSLIRHVYTLLMILILYFTCTNMYKHTTLFMHLSFWYLIWYEMFPLSLSFRYYQDLEAQRNRFRWVSRKQSDRWHQAHDAQVTKSQESKDSWRTRKMQRVCNHVIVNAAMMHHHIYIYTYICTWHHLTSLDFSHLSHDCLVSRQLLARHLPDLEDNNKSTETAHKKFPRKLKTICISRLRRLQWLKDFIFISVYKWPGVFQRFECLDFWLIELHVCLLPSNHFLKTSISKQLFGFLCPLWRCGCVSMKWMSQSCHPQHQAVEHTRWPTPLGSGKNIKRVRVAMPCRSVASCKNQRREQKRQKKRQKRTKTPCVFFYVFCVRACAYF